MLKTKSERRREIKKLEKLITAGKKRGRLTYAGGCCVRGRN
jgi:hypothetical protein